MKTLSWQRVCRFDESRKDPWVLGRKRLCKSPTNREEHTRQTVSEKTAGYTSAGEEDIAQFSDQEKSEYSGGYDTYVSVLHEGEQACDQAHKVLRRLLLSHIAEQLFDSQRDPLLRPVRAHILQARTLPKGP